MSTVAGFDLDRDLLARLDADAVPNQVAIVGAGRWAKVLCRVLAAWSPPISAIVIVAERNYDATRAWLDEQRSASAGFGSVSITPTLSDVVENQQIEAAFVTKMASEHFEATRDLLLAGKHVLVEKPFVLDPTEADELVFLSKARRRTLAVGLEFMFARTLHHLRAAIAQRLFDVRDVGFVWNDVRNVVRWGIRKEPDISANVVTDLYPHILSELLLLFGRHDVALQHMTTRDGYTAAEIRLRYGPMMVTASLDKNAAAPRRLIRVRSSEGTCIELDYTREPGRIELDGRTLPADPCATAFPPSLNAEIAYFFAQTKEPDVIIPNSAEQTAYFVEATDRANVELTARQTQELRGWLWKDLPSVVPEHVVSILRHQMLGGLLKHRLIANPKDTDALDRWVYRTLRIVHRFSREPWTEQAQLRAAEGMDHAQLIQLNAAIRESDFLQNLIVREGVARQYWSSILPLIETGSIDAVLTNSFQFPLRLGIYAAVSCMFSCTFCGRMENPDARYAGTDVVPGNKIFERIFAEMPQGISTLSLGGGLEPLTNPNLDDVIHSAKRYGHKVPLVTNGYMLTPVYVKRHPGLWDVDVLRISLYGVDDESYLNVTKKHGAFQLVKSNVTEFLKERRRRQAGPRVGFNFIVLTATTHEVLRILDLIEEINAAAGGSGIDFLTLREDFSSREGEGLSDTERKRLVAIFDEFNERRRRTCPTLSVDFGYALYPLSQGALWKGLAMVGHDRMLPKAYPQVSVALDLLGDVYLYRDAAFPNRPNADRYKIGTVTLEHSLEDVVREFIDNGRPIEARPNDTWLMDAFDHVVTNLIWQAQADDREGIPFRLGPIRRRLGKADRAAASGQPAVVNYWQGLFGA